MAYMGLMEKKMDTSMMGYIRVLGFRVEDVKFRVYCVGYRVKGLGLSHCSPKH